MLYYHCFRKDGTMVKKISGQQINQIYLIILDMLLNYKSLFSIEKFHIF